MERILGIYERDNTLPEMEFDTALFKKQCLGILKWFDEFCTKHQLRYSVAYGTMIGAIRHQGFIPWDDDVDVIMPRPDYDKFIKLAQDEIEDHYELVSIYNNVHAAGRWAKVIDRQTTLVETLKNKHLILGAFIDIFPIDGMAADEESVESLLASVCRHCNAATILSNNPLKYRKTLWNLLKFLGYSCYTTPNKELIKADRLAASVPFDTASSVMFYGSSNKYRCAFSPCLFDDIIDVPFENIRVKCFAKYDAYLTSMYGDYMKLPPKEYQVSHHYHYFVDLHRRWTFEELKSRGIV